VIGPGRLGADGERFTDSVLLETAILLVMSALSGLDPLLDPVS
jgi:hypothetical protein